jgi:COP9 signalosome complex subunit 2
MEDRQFTDGYKKLYEAFEYFVESGSDLMIPCLKYMLMANMLSTSDKVNPFADKSAQPLQQHKSIKPLSDLLDAYEKKDIKNFEEILRLHPQEFVEDEFLNQFIQEILTKVRIEVIKDKIKPYTSIRLGYLARNLNITSKEVEGLIVRLILDGEIFAKVDQINQVMVLLGSGGTTGKYQSMEKWAKQLNAIAGHLSNAIH